jgi:hypothetical protein
VKSIDRKKDFDDEEQQKQLNDFAREVAAYLKL